MWIAGAVYSFWCYIGISILIIWVTWSVVKPLLLIAQRFGLLMIGLTFCRRLWRYTVTTKYQLVRGATEALLVFGTLMIAKNGISILIFPIALVLLWICVNISHPELGSESMKEFVLQGLFGTDYSLLRKKHPRPCKPAKVVDFEYTNIFWNHVAMHFAAVYRILWLLACFGMGNFANLLLLGAISLAVIVISFSVILYCHDRLTMGIRDLSPFFSVTGEVITILCNIDSSPNMQRTVDTDRLQFLLHDTLKEKSGNHLETMKAVTRICDFIPGTINVADEGGALPFLIACQYSSLEVVEYLMGMDNHDNNNIFACDKNGDSALHYACRGKEIEKIKKILDMLPEAINVVDKGGALPLLIACQYSSPEAVEYLLGIGNNNVYVCDENGNSCLHYACLGNNFKVVKYLLTKHMHLVTKRNINGYLPLYLLCSMVGDSMTNDMEHLEMIWRLLLAYPEDEKMSSNRKIFI